MVHWRAEKMEDGSWIVAIYKDAWIQLLGPARHMMKWRNQLKGDRPSPRCSRLRCDLICPDLPKVLSYEGPEIEITPEMIEAGREQIFDATVWHQRHLRLPPGSIPCARLRYCSD